MTHKSGDQRKSPLPTTPSERGIGTHNLPSMFRLGDEGRNEEVLTDGKRILAWQMRAHDLELAQLAGWDDRKIFQLEIDGDLARLYVPQGTRNAPSLLSGKEAWSGEKKAVVERVGQYLGDIHERFGMHEIGFAWHQVGITPDHEVFIAPPNTPLPGSAEETQVWQQQVVSELEALLQGDVLNRDLVALFAQNLQKD